MRLFFILLLGCSLSYASDNAFELFHDANAAYDRGDYESAINKYQALLSQGIESGEIHFNLANALFRSKSLGPSIFHYRKALILSPRDADIKFNLSYAREKVTDQVENKEPILQRLAGLFESFNEKEAYYFLVASIVLLFAACTISIYKKTDWLRLLRNAFVVPVVFFVVATFYHSVIRSSVGVVTSAEAKVYSGVGKDNVVLFSLHEGVEFNVVESVEPDWVRIHLVDGKQGWVKSSDAQL